ncbi:MAG: adenine deaminase [bacterium]|nr:adenine deaminase [bacterium]
MSIETLISVSKGDIPADIVLKNGQIVNVLTGEIYPADVAIFQDKIAGIGSYHGKEEIDVTGKYIAPGFIDGHLHLESSMVTVSEFAKAVVPHGTSTIIIDPHEIANVLGAEGILYILKSSKYNPISVYIMLPSCVPATHLETAGAELKAIDLFSFFNDKWVLGLAEVMNYPGVLLQDSDVLDKLKIAGQKRIDGHSPGLSGKELNAYIAAGIASDHECTTVEEAREKLRLGMYVMLREGTVTKNLRDLLPLVTPYNVDRLMFVTDDRTPFDLMTEGHIDSMIRVAIEMGIHPVLAIRMATINTAKYFKLGQLGAIVPGYIADIVVIDDWKSFTINMVFKQGKKVAMNGVCIVPETPRPPVHVRSSINVKWLYETDFKIPAGKGKCRVIELIPHQITTRQKLVEPKLENGCVVADTTRDLLKLAVIERHNASGNIGLGLLHGFGLKSGALATSVAHDSHNLIVVGTNDTDMLTAAVQIIKMQGGLVVVNNQQIIESLPLPIAGLISPLPLPEVKNKLAAVNRAAKSLGALPEDPFMTLSFLALPVIPELKLTDKGLVDVTKFELVSLFIDA